MQWLFMSGEKILSPEVSVCVSVSKHSFVPKHTDSSSDYSSD